MIRAARAEVLVILALLCVTGVLCGCETGLGGVSFTPGATGAVCASPTDCASGICIEGSCAQSCDAGYQRDGVSCVDIDECSNPSSCSPVASCHNTPGSYTCVCQSGYFGDGKACKPTPLPSVLSVAGALESYGAIGSGSSCVIGTDQGIWCWGANTSGQLGDGTTTQRNTPVSVADGQDAWLTLSTNVSSGCGIKLDGSLWCWGSGALTTEPATHSASPTKVGGTARWVALSNGGPGCAIKSDGSLWCWAALGLTRVPGLWLAVTDAEDYRCGIQFDGSLWCWGDNSGGIFGTGTMVSSDEPVKVAGGPWLDVRASGGAICGLQSDGSLWCWGYYSDGSIAHQDLEPTLVNFGPYSAISVSVTHSCGIVGTALECWGYADYGDLGAPTSKTMDRVVVPGSWLAVSAGALHTCALTTDRHVFCWGANASGQIGDGTSGGNRKNPQQVGSSDQWSQVSVAVASACGVQLDGSAWCWGATPAGDQVSPVPLPGNHTWGELSLSDDHLCGVALDGALACLGANDDGQLGDGTYLDAASFVDVAGNDKWTHVSSGPGDTCGIQGDGTLWCWGHQPGQGEPQSQGQFSSNLPVAVSPTAEWAVTGAFGESLYYSHSCALDLGGHLSCWGNNDLGQLGDGTTTGSSMPVPVAGNQLWSSVTGGAGYTCAIAADKSLFCWGDNHDGRLGDGTTVSASAPTPIAPGTQWTLVAGGAAPLGWSTHTCAIRADGTLWCWGANYAGALGNGTTTDCVTPIEVSGNAAWLDVATAGQLTCAIRSDHTLWCWGDDSWGQLGDGNGWRSTPTAVKGLP